MIPLQVIDNFLIQYNVGQALLLLFILTTLGALPLKSRKIIGLNTVVFGLLLLLTPDSMEPIAFKFLGIAMIFVGPLLLVTARR